LPLGTEEVAEVIHTGDNPGNSFGTFSLGSGIGLVKYQCFLQCLPGEILYLIA
jgi:hypothetical protein